MKTYNNQIESFYLSNKLPLDKKTKISSLDNLLTEIPLFHRYLGLIFYVDDIKKFYTFKNDINTHELLLPDNVITNTFGITVNNYSNILSELNNFQTLGKIVFVFPLNVAFLYNGTTWEYYSGIYNLRNTIDLNNLSLNLRKKGVRVNFVNEINIWNNELSLVKLVTVTNTTDNLLIFNNPNQPVENRLYLHRNQLFQVINGICYKIGEKVIQTPNFTVIQGITKIHEILLSEIGDTLLPPYINANMWIYNNIDINNKLEVLIPLKLNVHYKLSTDKYEVFVSSDYEYTGTLEIKF